MYINNTKKPIPIKINGEFVDVNPGDKIDVPEGIAKRNGLDVVVECPKPIIPAGNTKLPKVARTKSKKNKAKK